MKKPLLIALLFFTLTCYGQDSTKEDVEAIYFIEWMIKYYEPYGEMQEGRAGVRGTTVHKTWIKKGAKLKGWEYPLTTRELWIRYYKIVNAKLEF